MSGLKRFFLDSEEDKLKIGGEAVLSGEEFLHAKNVLRIAVGDEVILLDNSGKEYTSIVTAITKKDMNLHILREEEGGREANTDVFVLFGYLKNADKNEYIVQKAVELGASRILCFSSEYSSAYMNDNKLERLNKVAKESAKQCLRSIAPQVEYSVSFEEALNKAHGFKNKIFACEFANESKADLSTLSGSTAIVIGSEGGFSEKEELLATKLGFSSITLGKRILRAETAAVALLSIVMFSLGELGERKTEGKI